MKKLGLLITLKAKEGREIEVLNFIKEAVNNARKEQKTITWYSYKIATSTFGIFGSFENETGRNAHLEGEVVSLLKEKSPHLLSEEPRIEEIEILSAI